jgi:hypothetical protein
MKGRGQNGWLRAVGRSRRAGSGDGEFKWIGKGQTLSNATRCDAV